MSVDTSEQIEDKLVLPEKVIKLIIQYLPIEIKMQFLLLCKSWSKIAAEEIYKSTFIKSTKCFESFLNTINGKDSYYHYSTLVRSIELSGTADIWMGDIEAALKPLYNLETFTISHSPNVTNILLHSLGSNSPQLKNLNLPGCVGITDAFVPQLCKSCKFLEKIDLSFTNVSVGVIPAVLVNLRFLKELNLNDSKESSSPVDMGDETFTRPLTTLSLRNSPINDQMLDWVTTRCPNIDTVILENCQNVTDISITNLAKKLKEIKFLDISFCDQITDASLNALASVENSKLTSLDLSYCDNITTRGIKQVGAQCTRLESLVLNGCENILNNCQQYCVGDECIIEGESIKRMVDGLEASNLSVSEDGTTLIAEDLIAPIQQIPKMPTEAELTSESKEKTSKGVVPDDICLTPSSLKPSKRSEGSRSYDIDEDLDDDDDDSLPSLNSQATTEDITKKTRRLSINGNNRKKGARSENSFRNSGSFSRKGSRRSSYYKDDRDSYDNRSRHSDVLNDVTNNKPKPNRRQSFNSQRSNQYQDQNNQNSNNTRYRPRSYIKKDDYSQKRYSNSHYSNHSNRYSNSENYPHNDVYVKGKGELLGKIKFMLNDSDGPKYISIHENDDPQDLGYNFCKYHNMMDIMEGVVRTIAIKKNAMRKKKLDIK